MCLAFCFFQGRFISEDTYEGQVDNPLTLNLYTYVYNNPLKYTDPSGHCGTSSFNQASDCVVDFIPIVGGAKSLQEAVTGKNLITGDSLSTTDRVIGLAGVIPAGKLIAKGGKFVGKEASKAWKSIFGTGKKVNPCNCFTAGTKVLTNEGEKNIEDIKVGDKVLAKDEFNPDGELAYKEVTALYRNQRDDIIKLHVGEQIIETTDNHPFWVEGKGWVFADELQVGDKLQKADGSNLTIDKVEFVKLDEPVTVYNFTVADFHTYYVTNLGIWVHNTKCTSAGTSFSYSYQPVKKGGKSIADQIAERGWNDKRIGEAIDYPAGIVNWTDQRKGMNNAPVTVYYHKNGGYVARRNDTGEIIQASDVNDPNWM